MKKLYLVFLLTDCMVYGSNVVDRSHSIRDNDRLIAIKKQQSCTLDQDILELQANPLLQRNYNEEWIQWNWLHSKRKEFTSLSLEEQHRQAQLMQGPKIAIVVNQPFWDINQLYRVQSSQYDPILTPLGYWDQKICLYDYLHQKKYGTSLQDLEIARNQLLHTIDARIIMRKNIQDEIGRLTQSHLALHQKQQEQAACVIRKFFYKKSFEKKEEEMKHKQRAILAMQKIIPTHLSELKRLEDIEKNKIELAQKEALKKTILENEQKLITEKEAFRLQIIAERKMLQDEKLKKDEARRQAQRAQSQAENAAKKEAELARIALQKEASKRNQEAQKALNEKNKHAKFKNQKETIDPDMQYLDLLAVGNQQKKLDEKNIDSSIDIATIMADRRKQIEAWSLQKVPCLKDAIKEYDTSHNLFTADRDDIGNQAVHVVKDFIDNLSATSTINVDFLENLTDTLGGIHTALCSEKKDTMLSSYFSTETKLVKAIALQAVRARDMCKDYNEPEILEECKMMDNEKNIIEQERQRLHVKYRTLGVGKIDLSYLKSMNMEENALNSKFAAYNKKAHEMNELNRNRKIVKNLYELLYLVDNKPNINNLGRLTSQDLQDVLRGAQAIIASKKNQLMNSCDFQPLILKIVARCEKSYYPQEQMFTEDHAVQLSQQIADAAIKIVSHEDFIGINSAYKQLLFESYLHKHNLDDTSTACSVYADVAKLQYTLMEALVGSKSKQVSVHNPLNQVEQNAQRMAAKIASSEQNNRRLLSKNKIPTTVDIINLLNKQNRPVSRDHIDVNDSSIQKNNSERIQELLLALEDAFENFLDTNLNFLSDLYEKVERLDLDLCDAGEPRLYTHVSKKLYNVIAFKYNSLAITCDNSVTPDELVYSLLQAEENIEKLTKLARKIGPALINLQMDKKSDVCNSIGEKLIKLNNEVEEMSYRICKICLRGQLEKLLNRISNPHEKA